MNSRMMLIEFLQKSQCKQCFRKIYALAFVNENDQNFLVLHCLHVISEVFILVFLFYFILFYLFKLPVIQTYQYRNTIFRTPLLVFFTPILTSLQNGGLFFFFHHFYLTHWTPNRKYKLKVYIMSFVVKMVKSHFDIKFMNSAKNYWEPLYLRQCKKCCMSWIVSPRKYMVKSLPSLLQDVTLLGNKVM